MLVRCTFVTMLSVLTLHALAPATALAEVRVISKPGEASPTPSSKKFDGIWMGPNNVTLMTDVGDAIVLHGKDAVSTWSATGIVTNDRVIVRGTGVTESDVHFGYESEVTLNPDGTVTDVWKAIFPGGRVQQGKDVMTRKGFEAATKGSR